MSLCLIHNITTTCLRAKIYSKKKKHPTVYVTFHVFSSLMGHKKMFSRALSLCTFSLLLRLELAKWHLEVVKYHPTIKNVGRAYQKTEFARCNHPSFHMYLEVKQTSLKVFWQEINAVLVCSKSVVVSVERQFFTLHCGNI